MNTTIIAGWVAGAISLVAFIPYIRAILKKEGKPNRASWFIWTLVGVMLGTSYYSGGASHTIWVPISYVIGPLAVAIISIRHGEGGWNRFDRFCLCGVLVSIVLWRVFNSPLIALILNIFIDSMGALPTLLKVYHRPREENLTARTLFLVGNIVNLFAVETWSFSITIYPIYMAVGTILIVALIFRGRRNISK